MDEQGAQREEQRGRAAHQDVPLRAMVGELWRSKLVKLALVLVLAGAGLWAYGAATRPVGTASGPAGGAGLPVVGLQGYSGPSGVGGGHSGEAEGGLAESVGPKLAGGGVSFIGAYGLGWLFRRFLKLAAIVTGLGVAGVAGLSGMGVLSEDDTAKVRGKLSDGGAWVQENAGAFKDRAMAVLPSSAAALGGLFVGFRRP